jgi:hypothetical protein
MLRQEARVMARVIHDSKRRGLVKEMKKDTGAQFEILVDGKTRTFRDTRISAISTGEFLKSRNPKSEVVVKDLQTGEITPVVFKPV